MNITTRTQLPGLLKELGLPLIAVEVGVAEGNHALDLLQNGIEHLYLVDRWQCYAGQKGDGSEPQEWHSANLQSVKDKIQGYHTTILQGDSVVMATGMNDSTLSLVYIDADHSYEGVSRDLEAWYPKIVPGGIIAGHDYLNNDYGVYKAVQDFCSTRGYTPVTIPETDPVNASFYFIKHS